MKVMTILGTRPEIIRLSAVLKCCDKYFDHVLVHTGQNWDYTLNQVIFDDLELRAPDHYLDCAGAHLGETMGNILAKSYALLLEEKPDAVLILGDNVFYGNPPWRRSHTKTAGLTGINTIRAAGCRPYRPIIRRGGILPPATSRQQMFSLMGRSS